MTSGDFWFLVLFFLSYSLGLLTVVRERLGGQQIASRPAPDQRINSNQLVCLLTIYEVQKLYWDHPEQVALIGRVMDDGQ